MNELDRCIDGWTVGQIVRWVPKVNPSTRPLGGYLIPASPFSGLRLSFILLRSLATMGPRVSLGAGIRQNLS